MWAWRWLSGQPPPSQPWRCSAASSSPSRRGTDTADASDVPQQSGGKWHAHVAVLETALASIQAVQQADVQRWDELLSAEKVSVWAACGAVKTAGAPAVAQHGDGPVGAAAAAGIQVHAARRDAAGRACVRA